MAERVYVLCAGPRSGSTLLCALLRASGVMGDPAEYLDPIGMMPPLVDRYGLRDAEGKVHRGHYIEALVADRTGPDGVFGIKLLYDHLQAFLPSSAFRGLLQRARFVHLRRRDSLAQAVSAAIAVQRGQWHRLAHEAAPATTVAYDRPALDRAYAHVLWHDAGWRQFFDANGITPLEIAYEDLLADADGICRAICRHAGVQDPPPFSLAGAAVASMTSPANADWLARYRASLSLSRPGRSA